jgi:hypothetical protein
MSCRVAEDIVGRNHYCCCRLAELDVQYRMDLVADDFHDYCCCCYRAVRLSWRLLGDDGALFVGCGASGVEAWPFLLVALRLASRALLPPMPIAFCINIGNIDDTPSSIHHLDDDDPLSIVIGLDAPWLRVTQEHDQQW